VVDYNYSVFDIRVEQAPLEAFPDTSPHVGRVAPDFPLEDLETGEIVRMKSLWAKGPVVIEFGSYT
jgi:hypothetical protein